MRVAGKICIVVNGRHQKIFDFDEMSAKFLNDVKPTSQIKFTVDLNYFWCYIMSDYGFTVNMYQTVGTVINSFWHFCIIKPRFWQVFCEISQFKVFIFHSKRKLSIFQCKQTNVKIASQTGVIHL